MVYGVLNTFSSEPLFNDKCIHVICGGCAFCPYVSTDKYCNCVTCCVYIQMHVYAWMHMYMYVSDTLCLSAGKEECANIHICDITYKVCDILYSNMCNTVLSSSHACITHSQAQ